jgi:uncharacterized protein YjbI with pentapeptide repeats
MSKRPTRDRGPPPALLRRLLDHQRWLNSNGRFGAQLDKSELQFDNCDLAGMNFSRAKLDYAYFSGGSVRGACFAGALLVQATFDGCDVEDADFRTADLGWANFLTNDDKAFFESANLNRTAWNQEQMDQNLHDSAARLDRSTDKLWPRSNKLEPR